jgi:hypothetical protein
MSKWKATEDLLKSVKRKPAEDMTKMIFKLYYSSLERKLKHLVDSGVDIKDISLVEKQDWKGTDGSYIAKKYILVENTVVDCVCIKHSVI